MFKKISGRKRRTMRGGQVIVGGRKRRTMRGGLVKRGGQDAPYRQ